MLSWQSLSVEMETDPALAALTGGSWQRFIPPPLSWGGGRDLVRPPRVSQRGLSHPSVDLSISKDGTSPPLLVVHVQVRVHQVPQVLSCLSLVPSSMSWCLSLSGAERFVSSLLNFIRFLPPGPSGWHHDPLAHFPSLPTAKTVQRTFCPITQITEEDVNQDWSQDF